MIIFPGIFFFIIIIKKFSFFGLLGRGKKAKKKKLKMTKKILSITLHISGTIYHMIVIHGTLV